MTVQGHAAAGEKSALAVQRRGVAYNICVGDCSDCGQAFWGCAGACRGCE